MLMSTYRRDTDARKRISKDESITSGDSELDPQQTTTYPYSLTDEGVIDLLPFALPVTVAHESVGLPE